MSMSLDNIEYDVNTILTVFNFFGNILLYLFLSVSVIYKVRKEGANFINSFSQLNNSEVGTTTMDAFLKS